MLFHSFHAFLFYGACASFGNGADILLLTPEALSVMVVVDFQIQVGARVAGVEIQIQVELEIQAPLGAPLEAPLGAPLEAPSRAPLGAPLGAPL